MEIKKYLAVTVLSLFATGELCLAQELVIYPAQGQTQEQLDKDKYECYSWAKGQTGFDPMQQPAATTPPPQKQAQQGGVVRGAARGAVAGTAVGAIAGDTGKGAGIGAAAGGLGGGMRKRDQQRQQQHAEQQWAQQQATEYQKNRDGYNRAYGACLEGRGYSVK